MQCVWLWFYRFPLALWPFIFNRYASIVLLTIGGFLAIYAIIPPMSAYTWAYTASFAIYAVLAVLYLHNENWYMHLHHYRTQVAIDSWLRELEQLGFRETSAAVADVYLGLKDDDGSNEYADYYRNTRRNLKRLRRSSQALYSGGDQQIMQAMGDVLTQEGVRLRRAGMPPMIDTKKR